MVRGVVVSVITVMLLLVGAPRTSAVVLELPADGPVGERFDAPTRFGPGHRGVDIEVRAGTRVGAAAPGRVTFAGWVAGSRWVTVDHGPVRTTVGPLASIAVARGRWVVTGTRLGGSGWAHGRQTLHWSARRGDRYVDPLAQRRLVATLTRSGGGRWVR